MMRVLFLFLVLLGVVLGSLRGFCVLCCVPVVLCLLFGIGLFLVLFVLVVFGWVFWLVCRGGFVFS